MSSHERLERFTIPTEDTQSILELDSNHSTSRLSYEVCPVHTSSTKRHISGVSDASILRTFPFTSYLTHPPP